MSFALFHKALAGTIGTLFDKQSQPMFKRVDKIRCWEVEIISMVSSLTWMVIQRLLYDLKNPKQLQLPVGKWLSKIGVQKIQKDYQQAIKEKMQSLRCLTMICRPPSMKMLDIRVICRQKDENHQPNQPSNNDQCFHHIETSQLICRATQLMVFI